MRKDAAQFVGQSGDLVELAGLQRDSDGWADLRGLDWTGGGVALTNLSVDKVRLEASWMTPRFVASKITRSVFQGMQTDGGLFGADDKWVDCIFEDIQAYRPITPLSRFTGCTFRRVKVDGASPHDTVFENCTFEDTTIAGLKCLELPRAPVNPEFHLLGESLLFKDCAFERTEFIGCNFRNVWFQGSKFSDVSISECDFSGIKSDAQWWGNTPSSDPFLVFLREAIDMAVARLGPACRAGAVMSQFLHEFRNGVADKREYADRLYDGSIPDYELDMIEDDLTALGRKYSL